MARLAIALLALLGAQLASAQLTSNLKDGQCVQTYDANTDYFPEKLSTRDDDAKYFEIQYFNNYKLITDHRNEQQYALVQCGTPLPTNLANGTEIYQVPVTSVAAVETTVVPYLEMLGVAETIHLVADGSMVSSSCFEKYQQTSGNVTELSATNMTLASQQVAAVQVQFGTSYYVTDNETVTTDEAYEPDVLGRASWIGYYAAFYNLEVLANQIIQNMTDNYNRLKQAASGYPDNEKPLVAWTLYDAPSQYNGNTASWNISVASYKAQLTQDAGGRLLNATQLQYFSASEFLQAITDVDILIDETYIATTLDDVLNGYQITDAKKDQFKFVKNQAVYREDGILTPAGGYDWFAGAVVMGDALLEDMINVVNPSAPSSSYQRHWLRNVAKNESIYYTSAQNCSWDESQPRPDIAITYTGGQFTMPSAAIKSAGAAATGWTAAAVVALVIAMITL